MVDVSKLSSTELFEYAKKKKAEEAAALAEKAAEIREEVDKYVQRKYHYTLAQIFTARKPDKANGADKDSVPYGKYINPDTSKPFEYRAGGRVPKWLRKLTPEQREARKST